MMMYSFATIRKYVRKNPDKDWYRPELIITQEGTQEGGGIMYDRYMKYPVSAAAQYEFVSNAKNWEYLQDVEDLDTEEGSQYNIRNTLNAVHQSVNLNIVEFDDEFAKKDLVYGITVNRTNKRITVFFRGSVTGGKDWTTNFNAFYKKLERTPELKDAKLTKDIKVHRGMQSEWLLGC